MKYKFFIILIFIIVLFSCREYDCIEGHTHKWNKIEEHYFKSDATLLAEKGVVPKLSTNSGSKLIIIFECGNCNRLEIIKVHN